MKAICRIPSLRRHFPCKSEKTGHNSQLEAYWQSIIYYYYYKFKETEKGMQVKTHKPCGQTGKPTSSPQSYRQARLVDRSASVLLIENPISAATNTAEDAQDGGWPRDGSGRPQDGEGPRVSKCGLAVESGGVIRIPEPGPVECRPFVNEAAIFICSFYVSGAQGTSCT